MNIEPINPEISLETSALFRFLISRLKALEKAQYLKKNVAQLVQK